MKHLHIIFIFSLLLFACEAGDVFKAGEESWTDIKNSKSTPIQSYKISNKKDTIIVGEKGIIVFIPKAAFKNVDSKPIDIQLSEFYSYTDFVLNNLTTTSNGQLLETRGMINLQAFQNGKPLTLNDKTPIKIFFPKTADTFTDFITFSGSRDSLSNINWIPDDAGNSISNDVNSQNQSTPNIDYEPRYAIGIGTTRGDCNISIMEYTSKVGSVDIRYKFKNRDDDVFNYFKEKFKIDPELKNAFCLAEKRVSVYFDINESGKIVNTKMKDSSNIKMCRELLNFLINVPPFDLSSVVITKSKKNIGNELYNSPDEFVTDFKKKYQLNSQNFLKKIDKNELDYYILYSTKLGWINCDRFYDIPQDQKQDLIVHTSGDNVKVYLLYKSIQSIQSEMVSNKQAVFKGLPLHSEIKIIAIYDNGTKTEIRKHEMTIGQSPEIHFEQMKTISLNYLEMELEL